MNLSHKLFPSNTSVFSFIVGSQLNLESVYAIVSFAKRLGFNTISQTYAPAQFNIDAPFLYSFNRTVQSLTEKPRSAVILLNTNIRYEASLISTIFRREQNRRATSFITMGSFTSLRYRHNHEGNSFRLLISSLENRVSFFKSRLVTTHGFTGIFVGVETLRSHYSRFLQKLARTLGKRLFTKTIKEDRLGFIHSTVGSLAFANQGILTENFNKKADSSTIFTFRQPTVSKSFYKRYLKNSGYVVSFDTHIDSFSKASKENCTSYIPTTTIYERTGHLRALEGRRRKHFKAVSQVSERRNLEVTLSALARKQGLFQWFS